MKKLVYIFVFFTQIIFAQTGFQNGNVLYKQGNYQEAIDVYETIIYRSQKQSAALYFNLANCYYKINKVAPTIYYYEKSLLINPNFESAKNNLEIAKKMQIDDIKIIPKVGIGKIIQNITSKLHYDTWAWFSVGFGFVFLLFFIFYYLSNNSILKRFFFNALLVIFLLMIFSVVAAISEKSYSENFNPAIIFDDTTSLLSAPKSTSKEIMKLHEGTKVFILAANNSLRKVQLTDGVVGWIEAKSIKELKK